MKFRSFVCGQLETNAWIIYEEITNQAILFDAPPESYESVQRFIEETKLELKALMITHPHWDHYLDAEQFHNEGIPVYCHEEASEFLTTSRMVIPEMLNNYNKKLVNEVVTLKDKEIIDIAGFSMKAYSVPGHCPGSLAFFMPEENICITGDVLFAGSIGRTDFPGGDFEQIKSSIKGILYTFPDETVILPGHGPRSTIGLEKQINAFVRA